MHRSSFQVTPRWSPTRAEAVRRLAAFVPRAGRAYAAQRNLDRGPSDRENVSTLSPYIRQRVITETEVLEAVLRDHSPAAAQKFIQEIFWRTYWKGWLEAHPAAWSRYRSDLADRLAECERDPDLARRYENAAGGQTGIEAFDFWVRELREANYLHNHARMWFASIWIFTLQLPWELGADLFMRHLLDGDPASNTLSWRWVAGLHTRGKTYRATAHNIAYYTAGRFPQTPSLARSAPPLHEPPIPLLGKPPTGSRGELLIPSLDRSANGSHDEPPITSLDRPPPRSRRERPIPLLDKPTTGSHDEVPIPSLQRRLNGSRHEPPIKAFNESPLIPIDKSNIERAPATLIRALSPSVGSSRTDPAVLLVVHDDDLLGDLRDLPAGVRGVCAFSAAAGRSPRTLSPAVLAFGVAVAAEAVERIASATGASALGLLPAVDPGRIGAAIGKAAKACGATRIVTPFAPVGPVRNLLGSLRDYLAANGLLYAEPQRRYDAVSWPAATRGFFQLKSQIPAILTELGIGAG